MRLTVTDALGHTSTTEQDVTVASSQQPPVAPANTVAPAITGTPQQGQSLTASEGMWTGTAPTTYSYLWSDGSTGATDTLTASDVGQNITVTVTATNAAGSETATSVQVGPVTALPLDGATPVASFTYSSSAPVTGQAVTFDGSSSTCGSTPCTYVWSDDGPDGPGGTNWPLGTGPVLTFTFDEAGTKYVRLTVTNTAGQITTVEHNVTVDAPPPTALVNTAAPAVSGTAAQGQVLTASTGTWTGSPTSYIYQWRQCDSSGATCTNVSGATSAAYTLTAGDVGHTMRVVVTATNPGGSTPATSNASGVVAAAPPTDTALPTVSGQAVQGQTLTATTGSWSGSPTSYGYKWQDCDSGGANCTNISGATASTYVLTASDVGHTMRAAVTASNADGSTTATSAATAAVTASGAVTRTTTVNSVAALQAAVSSAADGANICVSAGTYGAVSLNRSGSPANYVTVEPVIGTDPNGAGKITFTGSVSLSGPWIKWHGFYNTAGIELPSPYQGTSAKHIWIDHNDIQLGIDAGSGSCGVPDPPNPNQACGWDAVSYLDITGNNIHHCGGSTTCEDLIHLNNDQHVTISGNNMYDIYENGAHTDDIQNVWGAGWLTIDHNYMHDAHAEAWILKDGDLSNVTITDNLVTRNNAPDAQDPYAKTAWVVNTHNSIVRSNTAWNNPTQPVNITSDNAPPSSCTGLIAAYCSTALYDTTFDHNVVEKIESQYNPGYIKTTINSEGYNIMQTSPFAFTPAATDKVTSSLTFMCSTAGTGGSNICGNGSPTGDDYRLATNPNGIGIDWSPASQQYGPTN